MVSPMKKLTDTPSLGTDSSAVPAGRLRSAARALRRASHFSVRDGHDYEANRVAAELTIIAERRHSFNHFTR